jgi:hypothetical protein
MRDMKELATAARTLSTNISPDIKNASTRIEHIRLTQLAFEADTLATDMERLASGGDMKSVQE